MSRTCLYAVALLALAGCALAPRVPIASERVRQADKIVWAGLDYSRTQFVGTQDFHDPGAMFPGLLESWNSLFIGEMVDDLGKRLHTQVVVDIEGVSAQNRKATADQIIHKDGDRAEYVDKGHITTEDIAAAVKGYTLKAQSGIGLVFIIERLVKAQRVGCLYVVFFDAGTREILECRRGVYPAAGIGPRNFWFRPIKSAVGEF